MEAGSSARRPHYQAAPCRVSHQHLTRRKASRSIAVDPNLPSTLYASYGAVSWITGFFVDYVHGGIVKSSDGGDTWNDVTGLPAVRVDKVVVDPSSSSRVYAATEAGVFALIEYYHSEFDHYFITGSEVEIANLDSGAIAGWTRTGLQFNCYATPQPNSVPVCRFFSAAFAPKSSHFYTPFDTECAQLRQGQIWVLESGDVFEMDLPAAEGSCADSSTPVYRLYNNNQGGAPNHRFTIDREVGAQMLARGWIAEGGGADTVSMCSPL